MVLKCCTQYAKKSGKLSSGHRTGKGEFLFQSQRKAMQKKCSLQHNSHISHASKVMLKILQAKFQQYMNRELPDVQAGLRKGRGSRDQIVNIRWIIKKARTFQKKSTSALLTIPKPFTVWITTNYGKFFKWWKYQTTLTASWKQQLEPDMKQQTGSKLGMEYIKAVYCHPAF